ncbi:hypothetical protein Salat_1174800 [Sesamum alatum]|uniref:Uncharacterized protein n=1 Tax=Sesamum alatum TaxID=300844 RepID=A0AAE2CNV5_9LAMI|nr:hypothetical protein Salat_1174800 [Sesamum alatum]
MSGILFVGESMLGHLNLGLTFVGLCETPVVIAVISRHCLELGGPRAGARGTASSPGQSRRTPPQLEAPASSRGSASWVVRPSSRHLERVIRPSSRHLELVSCRARGSGGPLPWSTGEPGSARVRAHRVRPARGRGAPLELAWGGPGRGHGTRSRRGHGEDTASAGI